MPISHPAGLGDCRVGACLEDAEWFIDPADGWTCQDLQDDVLAASATPSGFHLELGGSPLDLAALCTVALTEGDDLDLVAD
jgi:hypothetical protein